MPRTLKKPNDRIRAHRGAVRLRIAAYPVADWLASALTPDHTEVTFWISKQEEDFPTIGRNHYIQDLHQVAREATQHAAINGEQLGYVVRTTTLDIDAEHPIGPDELGYWFIRLPIEECPRPRAAHTSTGQRRTAHGTPPAAPVEWRRLRYANSYCNASGAGWHTVGAAPGCPRCTNETAIDIGATPPAGWEYGRQIPGIHAAFIVAPEDYPLAPA